MLSVTENDEKPLKYTDIFAASDLMVLAKVDLLPYVGLDANRCIALARRIQPTISVVQLSATVGEGLDAWLFRSRARTRALPLPARRDRRPSQCSFTS